MFLSIESLWVYYDNALILEDINLSIEEKGLTAIIGLNGAGKTTLLKTLSRIVEPKQGSINFDGKQLLDYAPHKLAQLGITHCPEGRKLFPEMTVLENLMIGAYVLPRSEIKSRLEKIFELFPILSERKNQISITLSGGQQQMLALGRALMGSPKFLMIDEPSLGLSPLVVDELEKIILDIKKSGICILMVEGNVDMIRDLSDVVHVMNHGKIIYTGTVTQVLDDVELSKTYLGM
jgi:branched-chain amino acid transport system ATP-binding protein